MDIRTVTRRTEALFLPRENTPASLSETLTCEPVVFHHRRGDLVRSSRPSDLSSDRINSQCALLSTSMCICGRCAPCCNPRVRKYPAGRRPSSRRRVLGCPSRTYTVKYLWTAVRGFIGIGRYLRDTPARIVRPNNMPGAARVYAPPTMVSFVSSANIYDVTPWKIAPGLREYSLSSSFAATESAHVRIRRSVYTFIYCRSLFI